MALNCKWNRINWIKREKSQNPKHKSKKPLILNPIKIIFISIWKQQNCSADIQKNKKWLIHLHDNFCLDYLTFEKLNEDNDQIEVYKPMSIRFFI